MHYGIACDTIVVVRVVLDTSVLVAALRSNRGASFELLHQLRRGKFEIAVSVPLVVEYEASLLRHVAAPIVVSDVEAVVDYLCSVAIQQEIFFLWRPLLTDPKDDMVVEVAVAARCAAIVTHNVRDFALLSRFDLVVLTPAEFLARLRR